MLVTCSLSIVQPVHHVLALVLTALLQHRSSVCSLLSLGMDSRSAVLGPLGC